MWDLFGGSEDFHGASDDTQNAIDAEKARTLNPGSSYQTSNADYYNGNNAGGHPYGAADQRDFMYGRTPGGADQAAGLAQGTGAMGMSYGQQGVNAGNQASQAGAGMYGQHAAAADAFNNRAAPQGDFAAQNQTLGGLSGLEAQQGPSAAQAQLQQGTNQALSSQIALARSGRGFGGNAAAAGMAQNNAAGIQANQANQSSMLAAQENAAWRGRQAANMGTVAGMQGNQANADLQAHLAGQAQNDAAYNAQSGMGDDAYFKGQAVRQQGFGTGINGVNSSLNGQNTADNIRGKEMGGGATHEDDLLRQWAAENNYTLNQQQRNDTQTAAVVQGGATALSMMSDIRAKTNIAPSGGAGQQLARGDYSGGAGADGMIRDPWAGRPEPFQPMGQHGGAPPAEPPMTPMQAKHLGPGVLDAPNTRPVAREPDMAALDAASGDAVRNSPASFYYYKDPSAPGADAQHHYGPMAQDLLKTPAGASAVVQQPNGQLGVDTGRLALAHHGAINEQQKRIDHLSAQLDAVQAGQQAQGYDYKGYAR